MSDYQTSVANLLALAKNEQQEDNDDQALTYLEQAVELAGDVTILRDYLQECLENQQLDFVRQLLLHTEVEDLFLQQNQWLALWQLLSQSGLYLSLDQSFGRAQRSHVSLSPAMRQFKKEWQAKLAHQPVAEAKLSALAGRFARDSQNESAISSALAEAMCLTPSAFVKLVQIVLFNPTLSPFIRVRLLDNLRQLSDNHHLTMLWDDEPRKIETRALPVFGAAGFKKTIMTELNEQQNQGNMDLAELNFIQSRLTTYLLLTYPFTDTILQPLASWRHFIFSCAIPQSASDQVKKQMQIWQKREETLVNNLGQ